MARRNRWATPPKPFDVAFDNISTWERRVCYSAVTSQFTLNDVVEWLYPPDVLTTLREAYKLTSESHPDRTETISIMKDGDKLAHAELRIDCDDALMCTPKDMLVRGTWDTDRHGIVPAILEYERIHQEWNLVRDVVTWFNQNATPGAARYYFPAMGNFLPSEHPFHKGEGTRFAEPKESIGLIAQNVRQAAEIVTMAAFCPHAEKKERTGMLLTLCDRNNIHSHAKRSQPFIF